MAKVSFSSQGFKVVGILSGPDSGKAKMAVILCHGMASDKDSGKNLRLEKSLNAKKITTLRFDFFGHGESGGDFSMFTVSRAVQNIFSAQDFLRGLGFSKISLVGISIGGAASFIAESQRNSFKSLVLISPVSDYYQLLKRVVGENGIEDWKKKGWHFYIDGDGHKHKLNFSIVKDALQYNLIEITKKIKTPTLIVQGDLDKTVPLATSQNLHKLIKRSKIVVISGAYHDYSSPKVKRELNQTVVDFLVDNIR